MLSHFTTAQVASEMTIEVEHVFEMYYESKLEMEPRTDLLPSSPSQNWLKGKFQLETPRWKVKTAVLTAQFP